MAGDTVITIIGNITGDPELRSRRPAPRWPTSPSRPPPGLRPPEQRVEGRGDPVHALLGLRDAAENVAESLNRGTRVIVSGRLKSRSYETKEGEKHRRRDGGRRGRPLAAGVGQGHPRQQRHGGGGFGGQQGGSSVASRRTRGPPARAVLRVAARPLPPGRPGAGAAASRPAARAPRATRAAARVAGATTPRLRRAPALIQRNSIDPIPGQLLGLTRRRRAPRWPSPLCATEEEGEPLKIAKVENIDYKDTALLRKFISDRGKIRARRVTEVSVQEQRLIATAVKNAREMALLPYPARAR